MVRATLWARTTFLVSGTGGASTSHTSSVQGVATLDVGYFVSDRLSVGITSAGATFGYRDHTVHAYGIGPRVGYGFWLSERLTIYPSVAVIFSTMELPSHTPAPEGEFLIAGGDNARHGVTLSFDVPLLMRLSRWFVAGAGVMMRQDLINYTLDPVYRSDERLIGGFVTFGGWFVMGETMAPSASSYDHMPI